MSMPRKGSKMLRLAQLLSAGMTERGFALDVDEAAIFLRYRAEAAAYQLGVTTKTVIGAYMNDRYVARIIERVCEHVEASA